MRKVTQRTLSLLLAVVMLLTLLPTSALAAGGAQIELTDFTSSNAQFTTNNTNAMDLTFQVSYRITGTGDADGGEIRLALENDPTTLPNTFFATTMDRITITTTDLGAQHIDVAGAFVENVGGQNTLVIPFTGGEDDIALDVITVAIEYNREWDGRLVPGSALHTFEAWAVNDGTADATTRTVDVTSHTIDTRGFSQNSQSIILGTGHFGPDVRFVNSAPHHWQFYPGSQVTMTKYIPTGAEIVNPANPALSGGDRFVWVTDASNLNPGAEFRNSASIRFPAEHFTVGQQVPVISTITYYLMDAITGNPYQVTRTFTATVTLIDEGGGVVGGEVSVSWNHPALLFMFADQTGARNTPTDDINVNNRSDQPLENALITLYNNPGVAGNQTGTKARYGHWWIIANAGASVPAEWTFIIRNINGDERTRTVTQAAPGLNPGSFTTFNLHTSAQLAAGEYIYKVEIRPQFEGRNALAPGAEWVVRTMFTGFTATGIDHTGSVVGRNEAGYSDIPQRVTVTYDGIPTPFEREIVLRYLDPPHNPAVDARVATITTLHGGVAIAPGDVLPIRIAAFADSAGLFRTVGTAWEQPSFLVFVPAGASIDTSQTVSAYTNQDGSPLGNMTIAHIGTEPGGQRVYRLQTQPGVSLNQASHVGGGGAIRFDVNVNTPYGTPVGNTTMRIWAIAYAGEGAQHTLYRDDRGHGVTAGGLVNANGFFADINNHTGHNHLAPYLRVTTANLSYAVPTSPGMVARARMWDHALNQWQVGGTATVPVGGEGRFQLEIVNTGNLHVGDVRLYNVLPHGATTNTANGVGAVNSEWNATFQSLNFRVYDRLGAEITHLFAGSQIFVSQQYNSNPSANHPIVSGNINTDFVPMDATNILTARSFFFDLGNRRLDPGAQIVIEGTVTLPAAMTIADMGQTAQNSFVTSGQFFNTATGGTAEGLSPILSNTQTFMSSDRNNAEITGAVFQDLGNGALSTPLQGVTVRLYAGGMAPANFTGRTAVTDTNGTFLFDELSAGDYYVHFTNALLATLPANTSTSFSGDANANGFTNTITLAAQDGIIGDSASVDVGIVRTGAVRVRFHTGETTWVANITHTVLSEVNLHTDATGTITVGVGEDIQVPAGFTIVGATSQNYTLTWNNPVAYLRFDVVATHAVSYSFISGTAGQTLPAEVLALEPSGRSVNHGTDTTPTAPAETTVTVTGGTWTFGSWNPTSHTNVTAPVAFEGTWTFAAVADIIIDVAADGSFVVTTREATHVATYTWAVMAGELVITFDGEHDTVIQVNLPTTEWSYTAPAVTAGADRVVTITPPEGFEFYDPRDPTDPCDPCDCDPIIRPIADIVIDVAADGSFTVYPATTDYSAAVVNGNLVITLIDEATATYRVVLPNAQWSSSSVVDGANRVVTIVPPTGYTFEPGDPPVLVPPTATPTSVSIDGAATRTVQQGGTLQFSATVLPANASQSVTWSVTGHAGATFNPTSGLLTVAVSVPVGTVLEVTATTATGTAITSAPVMVTVTQAGGGGGGGGTPGTGTPCDDCDEYPCVCDEYEKHLAFMFGTGGNNFAPHANMTRAEFAAIIVRTELRDFAEETTILPPGMTSFTAFRDVNPNNWFFHYVAWAYDAGLVQGFDGEFRPNDPITRQEFAAMLARTGTVRPANSTSFNDNGDISNWAQRYVYTVYRDGLMIGDNNNFRPLSNITRAEAATAVNRNLGRIDSRAALNAADTPNLVLARNFNDVAATAWYFPSVVGAANDHRLTRDANGSIDWKYLIAD